MKVKIRCDWCGKEVVRYPCQIKPHNFCSRKCLAAYSSREQNPSGYQKLKSYENMSAHMKILNAELNSTRMNLATRAKLRRARLGTGSGHSYEKTFGRHTHRIVAEQTLGRSLKNGEVVHHIDCNKRNNDPDNLMVLHCQADHIKWHMEHDKKEGDADEVHSA